MQLSIQDRKEGYFLELVLDNGEALDVGYDTTHDLPVSLRKLADKVEDAIVNTKEI